MNSPQPHYTVRVYNRNLGRSGYLASTNSLEYAKQIADDFYKDYSVCGGGNRITTKVLDNWDNRKVVYEPTN